MSVWIKKRPLRILVIGNSGGLYRYLSAHIVAQFDRVIRVNLAHVTGFEKLVGDKRDILAILSSTAPASFAGAVPLIRDRRPEWDLYRQIWLTLPGEQGKADMSKAMGISPRKIMAITQEQYDYLNQCVQAVRKTDQTPSTGLTAIYLATQVFSKADICVTGFDQYSSAHSPYVYYWKDLPPQMGGRTIRVIHGELPLTRAGHGFDIERRIISDWVNIGIIRTIGDIPVNKPWEAHTECPEEP